MSDPTGTVVTVSGETELLSALTQAEGGETIVLAPGDYGTLDLDGQPGGLFQFGQTVTIRSEQLTDPAVFEGASLRHIENLTIDGVVFDYAADPGAVESIQVVHVEDSQSVAIVNSVFEGDLASGVGQPFDGTPTGVGLGVYRSANVTVDNNEFSTLMRGAVFSEVDGLVVSGNDVYDIRSDGLDFAEVTAVLIEENVLHDFVEVEGSGDHRDMIQFWTNGTDAPSGDIVIRNNILDSNDGAWTQSIFMRNELVDLGQAGEEMFYRDVVIADNVIRNAHANAILVGEAIGVSVTNNTVVHNASTADGSSVYLPVITVAEASQNVAITGNVAHEIRAGEGADWLVEDNLEIQRISGSLDHYYGDVFIDGLSDTGDVVHDLRAVPGGLIDQAGLGAAMLRVGTTSPELVGNLTATAGEGQDKSTLSFEVDTLVGPGGTVAPSDITSVSWDFGDGSSDSGPSVTHSFDGIGRQEVTAQVTLADGSSVTLTKTVMVETAVVLAASFDGSAADESPWGHETVVGSGVTFDLLDEGAAMKLNGDKVTYLSDDAFFNNEAFTVLIDIRADNGPATGKLVYFSGSFTIDVGNDYIKASVTTDEGSKWLKAYGLSIGDGLWHQLAVTFSSEDGTAALYVDQTQVAQVTGLEGAVQVGNTSHDLYLGDPWGSGYNGQIDNFEFLTAALTPEELAGRSGMDDSDAPYPFDEGTFAYLDLQDANVSFDGDATLQAGGGDQDQVVALDGVGDHVVVTGLSTPSETDVWDFGLEFRAEETSGPMAFATDQNSFLFGVDGSSLLIFFMDASAQQYAFSVADLSIDDEEWHSFAARLEADGTVQAAIDGEIVFETEGIIFSDGGGQLQPLLLGGTTMGFDFAGEIADPWLDDHLSQVA